MLHLDHDSLSFIYENTIGSLTLTIPLLHFKDNEIKEIKFDIYNRDGLYRTNLLYKENLIEIPENTDIIQHLKDVESILEKMTFCKTCDCITTIGSTYLDNCYKCTFVKSFRQDHFDHKCCICQENIENDWLKMVCCGGFMHKQCRWHPDQKWAPCALCRCEEVRYN